MLNHLDAFDLETANFAEIMYFLRAKIHDAPEKVIDKPITIGCGSKSMHVNIGPDFKPNLLDAKTGKKVSSLPKSAPETTKKEFKTIRDSIRIVSVAKRDRLEDLMLREYRWPVSGWFQKYPLHPILRIFASKIVWGRYGLGGSLEGTFRLLEDGTATDSDDNIVTQPQSGSIGIVHPVELDHAMVRAWKNHFSEYKVLPEFPQLQRKPFSVLPDEIGKKFLTRWQGREFFTDRFLKRAEKCNWTSTHYSTSGMKKIFRILGS